MEMPDFSLPISVTLLIGMVFITILVVWVRAAEKEQEIHGTSCIGCIGILIFLVIAVTFIRIAERGFPLL